MKLNKLVKDYIKQIKPNIKRRTFLFYTEVADNFISKQFNISLSEINKEVLHERLMNNAWSNSTRRLVKSLINRSLTFAFSEAILTNEVRISLAVKTQDRKKVNALDHIEQEKLESYILSRGNPYYYGILISLYTGLRIGELVALKWQNVDLENKIMLINKTASKMIENHKLIDIESSPKTDASVREIPLSQPLIKLLKNLKGHEYVLSNMKGERLCVRTYQEAFSRILKRLNIKHYGFHALRHTFATRCLEVGIDIKTISELLGHANPSITLNRYVHSNLENKRKALDLLTKKAVFKKSA